jgi:hypothetical protein
MNAPAPTWNAAFPLLSPREQERLWFWKLTYEAEDRGFSTEEAGRLVFHYWRLRTGRVDQ